MGKFPGLLAHHHPPGTHAPGTGQKEEAKAKLQNHLDQHIGADKYGTAGGKKIGGNGAEARSLSNTLVNRTEQIGVLGHGLYAKEQLTQAFDHHHGSDNDEGILEERLPLFSALGLVNGEEDKADGRNPHDNAQHAE